MRDDRSQPGRFDVLRERIQEVGRAREGHLHQDAVRSLEEVAVRVLLEQRAGRRQLEAEPQLEPRLRTHPLVGLPDLQLALFTEREVRPDVRRRKEDRRPVLCCASA